MVAYDTGTSPVVDPLKPTSLSETMPVPSANAGYWAGECAITMALTDALSRVIALGVSQCDYQLNKQTSKQTRATKKIELLN